MNIWYTTASTSKWGGTLIPYPGPIHPATRRAMAAQGGLQDALRDSHKTGGYAPKDDTPDWLQSTQPGERTQEQIIADCEAAYAKLLDDAEEHKRAEEQARIEAAKPKCAGCRWHEYDLHSGLCTQPLVKGLGATPKAYDGGRFSTGRYGKAKLCGPEKALWEPKLNLWQRLWNLCKNICN